MVHANALLTPRGRSSRPQRCPRQKAPQADFRERVRDERKFASIEELKAQIARDAEQVRRMEG